MTQWWLIALGGLLGSSHCLGMCGPFAAIVGMRSKSLGDNLRSQFIYSAGRLISYATIGGVAGFAGHRVSQSLPQIINVPALLCLFAGLFLAREGLLASGLLKRRVTGVSTTGCLMAPLFSTILRKPGAANTFTAGVVTGLLPCGLVYAFVSLAASSTDLLQGMAIMVVFGSGTIPLMVAAGCGTTLLSWSARQRLWKLAAWSVLATGLLTIGRGVAFFQMESQARPQACPFCSNPKQTTTLVVPSIRDHSESDSQSVTDTR